MTRYAAFLRGVMPTNCKMAELREAFEAAGFDDVKTVLGSGNVLFSARAATEAALERKAEAGMQKRLGRTFFTIVRPVTTLREILAADPFRGLRLAPKDRRVVTFLREKPKSRPELPVEVDGARILRLEGREAYTIYWPTPRGPVFMTLIEKTLGKNVTTRTWETLQKMAK